jgi:hypothetical protein
MARTDTERLEWCAEREALPFKRWGGHKIKGRYLFGVKRIGDGDLTPYVYVEIKPKYFTPAEAIDAAMDQEAR